MSEQGWTQVPWEYGVRPDGSIWISRGNPMEGAHYQSDFCGTEKDAAVTCAARDLYAALDAIASLWRLPECSNELVARMITEQVIGPAMTALAKARGEA